MHTFPVGKALACGTRWNEDHINTVVILPQQFEFSRILWCYIKIIFN